MRKNIPILQKENKTLYDYLPDKDHHQTQEYCINKINV